MHRPLNVSPSVFAGGAGVQQRDLRVVLHAGNVVPVELLNCSVQQVANDEPGHVHRILRGGKGRCVGQLQLGQIRCPHLSAHGGGQHVDAFVRPLEAHDLRSQNPPAAAFEHSLDCHIGSAGIVSRVGRGEGHYLVEPVPRGFGSPFVESGCRHSHVEHPQNGGALAAVKTAVPAADVVGGNPPLLVGRPRQRHPGRISRHGMGDLHRVAHGVYVGRGGFHPVVDHDGAPSAQRQPCFLG